MNTLFWSYSILSFKESKNTSWRRTWIFWALLATAELVRWNIPASEKQNKAFQLLAHLWSPLLSWPNKEHFLLTQPPPKSRGKKSQNLPLSLNRAGEPALYLCPPPETLSHKLRPVTAGRQVFSPCFSLALELVYLFNLTIKARESGKALLSLAFPLSPTPGTVNCELVLFTVRRTRKAAASRLQDSAR